MKRIAQEPAFSIRLNMAKTIGGRKMKKILAIVFVVMLLAAMAPFALAESAAPAAGGEITVYFTASVDGKIQVAAEPVKVTEATVDGALKAAHKALFSGGESGYGAGIDATWNMFLINTCWGVKATPFVLVNGIPTGAEGLAGTPDTIAVHDGDNIVVSTATDSQNNPSKAIGLTAEVKDGSATLTAIDWVLDFTSFTYSKTPVADAEVTDPATGTSLGKTDAEGKITVTAPESGVVAVAGTAAIRVDGSAKSAEEIAAAAAAEKAANAAPLFYDQTYQLIIITVVLMVPVFVVILVNMSKQARKDKKAAQK
jgi:hypothetical protein